jgi:hypothetical protein
MLSASGGAEKGAGFSFVGGTGGGCGISCSTSAWAAAADNGRRFRGRRNLRSEHRRVVRIRGCHDARMGQCFARQADYSVNSGLDAKVRREIFVDRLLYIYVQLHVNSRKYGDLFGKPKIDGPFCGTREGWIDETRLMSADMNMVREGLAHQ